MRRLCFLLLVLLIGVGCSSIPSTVQMDQDAPEAILLISPAISSKDGKSSSTIVLSPEIPPAATPLPTPTATLLPIATSEPTATPGPASLLPLTYLVYDEAGLDAKAADMFYFDFDLDGTDDTISFKLNTKKETTTIVMDDTSITLKEGCDFLKAILLDLDPNSPYLNLLIVIDSGSDDYVTVELHLEDGELKRGPKIEADCAWMDGALWFFERTDILGTATGKRIYSGDILAPDSEWLTMTYIPSEEELRKERKDLIEFGTLLHVIRPLPCLINDKEATIPKGTYLYRLYYNEGGTEMIVSTLDGVEAVLKLSSKNQEYRIGGKEADRYFDNILYAD